MPTLAELMAKKGEVDLLGESLETRVILTPEGPHYGKKVDGSGKFIKWVSKPTGTVIRAVDEKAKLAASIKATMDDLAPKVQPPAPRELGAIEKGERIPMDYPSEDQGLEWFRSCHSFDSDMGIVIEPGGEMAWVAVKAPGNSHPILLLRLPLMNRAESCQPF
jgi:hypothetical protein